MERKQNIKIINNFQEPLSNNFLKEIESFSLMNENPQKKESINNSSFISLATNFDSNKVLGYVLVQPKIDRLPSEIQFIEVLPEARNRGIGKLLVYDVIDFLKKRGENCVSVFALSDREKFFEKIGFAKENGLMILKFN